MPVSNRKLFNHHLELRAWDGGSLYLEITKQLSRRHAVPTILKFEVKQQEAFCYSTLSPTLLLGSWMQFQCGGGISPTPPRNCQTPAGCPTLQLDSDTIFLEIA